MKNKFIQYHVHASIMKDANSMIVMYASKPNSSSSESITNTVIRQTSRIRSSTRNATDFSTSRRCSFSDRISKASIGSFPKTYTFLDIVSLTQSVIERRAWKVPRCDALNASISFLSLLKEVSKSSLKGLGTTGPFFSVAILWIIKGTSLELDLFWELVSPKSFCIY